MNTVQLVGRLTKEVDLKFTNSGIAVGTFTLAVNRSFTNQQGEREADFITCVIWRKAAENLANFTRKGSQIGVEGRIQTRNYENQQGQRVYVTEVVVSNFHLLEPRSVTEQRPKGSDNSNSQSGQSYNQNYNQDYNSNNNYQQQQNNAYNNNSYSNNNQYSGNSNNDSNSPFNFNENDDVSISEDDLPF